MLFDKSCVPGVPVVPHVVFSSLVAKQWGLEWKFDFGVGCPVYKSKHAFKSKGAVQIHDTGAYNVTKQNSLQ